MTAPAEMDYFRELDFLDFPAEEKFMYPPQMQQTFGYGNINNYYHPIQTQQQIQPTHYATQTQRNSYYYNPATKAGDDLFSALNLDPEDRELLGSLEPLAPPTQELQTLASCDTIDVFEMGQQHQYQNVQGIKRERGDCMMEAKKRKLNAYSPDSVVSSSVNSKYEMESEDASTSLKYKSKQKRTKWMRKEVQSLWEGIATYGNNWRLIKKKAFGHRTYYQVKDKGRRILSSQGWSSGRTKATHDGASEEAKVIAEKVLMSLPNCSAKVELKSEEGSVVAGSTGSPTSSDGDSELDFDLDFEADHML